MRVFGLALGTLSAAALAGLLVWGMLDLVLPRHPEPLPPRPPLETLSTGQLAQMGLTLEAARELELPAWAAWLAVPEGAVIGRDRAEAVVRGSGTVSVVESALAYATSAYPGQGLAHRLVWAVVGIQIFSRSAGAVVARRLWLLDARSGRTLLVIGVSAPTYFRGLRPALGT